MKSVRSCLGAEQPEASEGEGDKGPSGIEGELGGDAVREDELLLRREDEACTRGDLKQQWNQVQ